MLSHLLSKKQKPSTLDKDIGAAYAKLGIRSKDTPVEPGLARSTLIDILTRHADLLAHQGSVAQAGSLFALAIELADDEYISDLVATEDGNTLIDRARAFMRRGHFVPAIKLYEKAIETSPANGEAHKNLAALYSHIGEAEYGRTLLTSHYTQHPQEAGNTASEAAPVILCMYGYDKTQIKLGFSEDKGFYRYRSGGHFMLQHLLNEATYNIFRYTIAGDNINTVAPSSDHAIIVNTVADADTEYNSLKSLEKYLGKNPATKIINHPTRVLETTRDNNYARLNTLQGFRFPRTERFITDGKTPQELTRTIEQSGFSFPLIIRETGTHTAVTTALIHKRDDLEQYLATVSRSSVYVIEFIENASNEGHYSKIRFFSIDGALYPVVYHTDEVWNVHGDNRKTFMASFDWMVEREQKFLDDPVSVIGSDVYQRLQDLPKLIGLDFFGFDFTLLESGEILIFELNPAMRHSFKHGQNFPYMMPHLQKISAAFDTMVRKRIQTD